MVKPVIFPTTQTFSGAVSKTTSYMPGVRSVETGELVAYVPVRMSSTRAFKCATAMADERNGGRK